MNLSAQKMFEGKSVQIPIKKNGKYEAAILVFENACILTFFFFFTVRLTDLKLT